MRIYSGFLTSIGKVIKKKKIESKREDCEFLEKKNTFPSLGSIRRII